jgi:hypothetical protein
MSSTTEDASSEGGPEDVAVDEPITGGTSRRTELDEAVSGEDHVNGDMESGAPDDKDSEDTAGGSETPRLVKSLQEESGKGDLEDGATNGKPFHGYAKMSQSANDGSELPMRPADGTAGSPAETLSNPDDTPSVQVCFLI